MAEPSADDIRRLANTVLILNRNAEERERLRGIDHAEMRLALSNLKEVVVVLASVTADTKVLLSAIDKQLGFVAKDLDEARHEIEDLTPPLGFKLEQAIPQPVDREQSWKVQLGGALSLGKKVWPYGKWVIHAASAIGGGTIIARLFVAAFGRR